MSALVDIRPAGPEDVGFVLAHWVRSWRDSPYAGTIRNHLWHEAARASAVDLLMRGSRALVASPRGSTRLCGFAVYEAPDLLHYLYVRHRFRGVGVARDLLAAVPQELARFTHRTRASDWLFRRGLAWDPVPARVKLLRSSEGTDGQDSTR